MKIHKYDTETMPPQRARIAKSERYIEVVQVVQSDVDQDGVVQGQRCGAPNPDVRDFPPLRFPPLT